MSDIITVLLVVLAIISLLPGNKKKKEEQQRRQAEKNKNRRRPEREPQPDEFSYEASEEQRSTVDDETADSNVGHKYTAKNGERNRKKTAPEPAKKTVRPGTAARQAAAPAFTAPEAANPQVNALTVMAKEVGTTDPLAYAMLMSEIFQPPLSKRERKKP